MNWARTTVWPVSVAAQQTREQILADWSFMFINVHNISLYTC